FALNRDDVLAARLPRRRDGLRRAALLVEDDLHESAAVPQGQEDQIAQIPPARHPPLEKDGLARIRPPEGAPRLPRAAHRSLAAPRRSASSTLGNVCCVLVARSLSVT